MLEVTQSVDKVFTLKVDEGNLTLIIEALFEYEPKDIFKRLCVNMLYNDIKEKTGE